MLLDKQHLLSVIFQKMNAIMIQNQVDFVFVTATDIVTKKFITFKKPNSCRQTGGNFFKYKHLNH